MATHRVGLVGDIERYQDAASGTILMRAHARHHGTDTLADRGPDGVRVDLIVLDEIESGGAQLAPRALPVCPADMPTFGLMMVPSSGRSCTAASERVPATPWRGIANVRR